MSNSSMPSVEIESFGGTCIVPLETRLLMNRQIFLNGPIDAELAIGFMASMIFLSDVSDEPVTVLIDSPGGEITQGMLIYDVIQSIDVPVNMICTGIAASMAAVIFASGQKGRRYILKHSKVMIHEPLISDVYGGSASSVMKISRSLLKTRDMLSGILAEHTGRTAKEINAVLANEKFMDAEEAIDFGICDSITDSLIIR